MLRSPVGAKNVVEPVVSASQPLPSTATSENKTNMNKTITVRKSIGEIEARIGSPQLETPKYASKLAEARACVMKVKLQLGASRNTKKEIVSEVIGAVERLYQLVKESQGTPKPAGGADKEKDKEKVKDKTGEDECVRDMRDERVILGQKEILQKLEENNRLMMENKEKLDRIGSLVESAATGAKTSYADVASVGAKTRFPEAKALHSVVVSSSNEQETSEQVVDKIRKTVEAKDGWVKVERVRKVKDRKVIVGCATVEDREKVKNRLKGAPNLRVEEMKNKDPLLIFRDVFSYNGDEEVVKALRNQNRGVFEAVGESERRMNVLYRKRARNPHQCHIVARVSPRLWAGFLEEGSAYIDLQRVKVADESPLVQCSRCLGYGHTRKYCKEKEESCSHCGGPHKRTDCQQWLRGETPRCCNCMRAGLDNVEHGAFGDACPIRRKWDGLARATVAYC